MANNTTTTVQVCNPETTNTGSAVSIPEGPTGQPDKQADEMEENEFEVGEMCDSTANIDAVTGYDAQQEPEPMDTADDFTETASLGRTVTASGETAKVRNWWCCLERMRKQRQW